MVLGCLHVDLDKHADEGVWCMGGAFSAVLWRIQCSCAASSEPGKWHPFGAGMDAAVPEDGSNGMTVTGDGDKRRCSTSEEVEAPPPIMEQLAAQVLS